MADAAIVAWDAKYTYNTWRPIQLAGGAGTAVNSQIETIANWEPLINTPPFPEYVSGHSTFSGAAAAILTAVFGDNYSFSIDSVGLPGVTRSYTSFEQAAEEAGMSRIYGGIHFLFSDTAGLTAGGDLAAYVLQTFSTSTDKYSADDHAHQPGHGQRDDPVQHHDQGHGSRQPLGREVARRRRSTAAPSRRSRSTRRGTSRCGRRSRPTARPTGPTRSASRRPTSPGT